MSETKHRRSIKVLNVSADGMSAEIEGLPLADLGIESMWVINPRTGEILYELTGFAWPVETGLREALRRAIPPDCDLVIHGMKEIKK